MTGFPTRIIRGGRPETLDLDELSDAELAAWGASLSGPRARAWAVALARWIRDHVRRADEPGGGSPEIG